MAKSKIKDNSMKNDKTSASRSAGLAMLYTAALVVAALAIIAASSFLVPNFGPGMRGGMMGAGFGAPPPEEVGRALDSFTDMRSALAIFNIIIVIYLLYIHIKDYLRIRSSFTLGLVAFLASFLMYAISTLPEMHLLLGSYGRAAMISFVPMMFSAIGLLIFAKLSNE